MLGRYGKGKLFLFFDLKKRVLKESFSEGAKLISFIQEWTLDQNEMWEYRDWQIFYIEIKKNSTRLVNSN